MFLRYFVASFVCLLPLAVVANPHDVTGMFATQDKTSHIQIEACNEGSLCGKVAWIDPDSMQAGLTPETAKSKNGEPILGLIILKDFKKKKNDWRGGTIYDPGKDKLYASRLKRLEDGSLQVKGCIAFFCQTQVWTPVLP